MQPRRSPFSVSSVPHLPCCLRTISTTPSLNGGEGPHTTANAAAAAAVAPSVQWPERPWLRHLHRSGSQGPDLPGPSTRERIPRQALPEAQRR